METATQTVRRPNPWAAILNDRVVILIILLLATLFVPLTAGLWWSRTNTPGALAAVAVGLVSWLACLWLAPHLPGDLVAVPFAALALVGVSLATGRAHPPQPLRDADGAEIPLTERLGL